MFAAPKWPIRQIFGGHPPSNCANPAMARSRSDTDYFFLALMQKVLFFVTEKRENFSFLCEIMLYALCQNLLSSSASGSFLIHSVDSLSHSKKSSK